MTGKFRFPRFSMSANTHAVLLRILRGLRATRMPYSLDDLLTALTSLDALRTLATLVPEEQRGAELEPIVARWKDYQLETAGMRAQLDALLLTDFGPLLTDPQPSLDLAKAYGERSIVYFALPVARFPQTAPLVARLVIGDLNSVTGLVQDGSLPKDRGLRRNRRVRRIRDAPLHRPAQQGALGWDGSDGQPPVHAG